jgi:hypothetical protein
LGAVAGRGCNDLQPRQIFFIAEIYKRESFKMFEINRRGIEMNINSDTNIAKTKENITFDAMQTNEEIVIETQNSAYKFCIGDAATRQGFLSGGTLGESSTVAILMGTISKNGEHYINDPCGLKTEARAFFFIQTENGMKHLITSVITHLVHIKNEEPEYIC